MSRVARSSCWFRVCLMGVLLAHSGISSVSLPSIAAESARPQPGDEVAIVANSGELLATAAVTEIVDPFEDVDASQICCGIRFISLTVEVQAEADGVTVNPAMFKVVQDMGWAIPSSHETRYDDRAELHYSKLDEGESVSGSLIFALYPGSLISRVIWITDEGNIHTIAQLVPNVEPEARVTQNAGPDAMIFAFTVPQVVDPYIDVRKSSAPPDGFRFIGATVTIENLSQAGLAMEPNRFILVSSTGRKFGISTTMVRLNAARSSVPDLTDESLQPGEVTTGFVGFMVPADVQIASLLYYDFSSGAFVPLWDAPA